MSSSVCQGLQSCLEPRLVKQRVLIQNLAPPPKSNFSQCRIPCAEKANVSQQEQQLQNDEMIKSIIINDMYCYNSVNGERESNKDGGDPVWSSIKALTTTWQASQEGEQQQEVYVHPLVKRSSSTLSSKSLEMCTESLGSETGSSTEGSIQEFPSRPSDEDSISRRNSDGIRRSRSGETLMKKLERSHVSFPPPLTSISGSDGVQVRPLREGGRLVLKAVTISSCSSYFQAERSNGRLRLSLLKNHGYTVDSGINNIHDDLDEYEENAYNIQHEEQEEQENADKEVEAEIEEDNVENEMEANNGENLGYEINGAGVNGEFPRPCRCKEGRETTRRKGMTISLGRPCLVTIS